MMLQTVFTAFCRFLCQCKSLLFAGRIPYSVLKTCREVLTSMSKIGVTCLLTLGQLEFILKWIRNTLMKKEKKERGLEERNKSKFCLISCGWKQNTSICGNTLCEEISDTHFHLFSSVCKSICHFFQVLFEVAERTCNFKLGLLLILLLLTCLSDFWLFQRWQRSTPLAQENERAWPVTPGGRATEKPNQSMYCASTQMNVSWGGQKWCLKCFPNVKVNVERANTCDCFRKSLFLVF